MNTRLNCLFQYETEGAAAKAVQRAREKLKAHDSEANVSETSSDFEVKQRLYPHVRIPLNEANPIIQPSKFGG